MKRFGTFTTDGFRGSIEFPRFIRAVTNDLKAAIAALVGTSPVFITGGTITEAGGNTTVTDGLLLVDGKIYTFTGGTYPGAPAALNILLQEQTAEGYPVPYLGTTPTDIYLDNVAKIDASGTLLLSAVGNIFSHTAAQPILASVANKADKNGYSDISAAVAVNPLFTVVIKDVRLWDDGTVSINMVLSYDGIISADTLILSGLPSGIVYSVPARINGTSGKQHVSLRQNDLFTPDRLYADQSLADLEPSPGYRTAIGISYCYKKI